jgi:hypothetical protein
MCHIAKSTHCATTEAGSVAVLESFWSHVNQEQFRSCNGAEKNVPVSNRQFKKKSAKVLSPVCSAS